MTPPPLPNPLRFLPLVVFTIILVLTILSSNVDAGRCVPVEKWSSRTILTGFIQISCFDVLQKAGITHHWIEDTQVPDGDLQGTCASAAQFVIDAPARELGLIFTETQPSTACKSLLSLNTCLAQFKKCEPKVDSGDVFQTATINKPCRWLCDLVYEQHSLSDSEAFCTAADLDYLSRWGVVLTDIMKPPLAELDCNDSVRWSQNQQEGSCLAASVLPTTSPQHTCQLYTGDYCKAVFTHDTYVTVPAGMTIEEMEADKEQFKMTLGSLPRSDERCARALVRLICGMLFPECLNVKSEVWVAGHEEVIAHPMQWTPVATSLRLPTDACTEYEEFCSPMPLWQRSWAKRSLVFPICEHNYGMRPSTCFPRGLTIDMASDYVPNADNMNPTQVQSLGTNYNGTDVELDHDEFSVTQTTQQKAYTMRQISQIDRVVHNYDMNTLMFMSKYQNQEIMRNGPQILNAYAPIAYFHTQTYSGTILSVNGDVPYPETCPPPLVIPDRTYENDDGFTVFGAMCAIPCPNPSVTHSQQKRIETASFFFVVFSLFFAAILAVTFVVFKSQRHKWILFWYSMSYFGLTLFLFQGLLNQSPGRDLYASQCESNTKLYHMKGFGLYQAMGLVFFTVSCSVWWLMICVDLFERLILGRIYFRNSSQYKRRKLAMHLFSWGTGFLSVLGLIVGGQLGYDGMLPFAFTAIDPLMDSDPIRLSIYFIFIPLFICAVGCLICLAIIGFFLARHNPNAGLQKFAENFDEKKSFRQKVTNMVKLFGFFICMVPFIVLIIWHELDVGANARAWADALLDWGEHRLFSVGAQASIVKVDRQLKPGFIILTVFGFASPGIFMFILYFLFSSEIIKLWCGFWYFQLGCQACKKWAKEDVYTGTESGGSRGSSSNGSTGSAHGHSSDLFGSIELNLTKRAKERNTTNESQSTAVLELTTLTSQTNDTSKLATSPSSPGTSADSKRRKQLFRGMSVLEESRKSSSVSLQKPKPQLLPSSPVLELEPADNIPVVDEGIEADVEDDFD